MLQSYMLIYFIVAAGETGNVFVNAIIMGLAEMVANCISGVLMSYFSEVFAF
jgi:hypothetical protein